MSISNQIMEFAEKKKQEGKDFCWHDLWEIQGIDASKQPSVSSLLSSFVRNGGLVETEYKGCPKLERPHKFFAFNKHPERRTKKVRRGDAIKSVLEYAKDKETTKKPYFCSHDIEFLGLGKGVSYSIIAKLMKRRKDGREGLDELFNSEPCQFSSRKHSMYRYVPAKKEVLKGIPMPEKPSQEFQTIEKVITPVMQAFEKTIIAPQTIERQVISDFKKVEIVLEAGRLTVKAEK